MSTLLSTVERLEGEEGTARDRRVPYVGQWVLFHARPGEGRQGKLVTPAMVIAVEDDDHVEILITYAADDAIVRWKIARRSEQNPINCWSFNQYDEEHYQPNKAVELPVIKETGEQLTWEDVKAMYDEIGMLRRERRDWLSELVELRNLVTELEAKTTSATTVRLPHAAKKNKEE